MLLTQVTYDDLSDGSEWYPDDVDALTVFSGGRAGWTLRETISSSRTEHVAGDIWPLAEER
jgi:hypothetical protein